MSYYLSVLLYQSYTWDGMLRILVGDGDYILCTKQVVDSGSGLLRLSRESPWVIAAYTSGGLLR